MMHPVVLVAALFRCRKTAGDQQAIAELQEKIRLVLVDRITVLTSDYWLITGIISDTMELFAKSLQDTDEVNWKAWIVAIALSLASERVSATEWLDSLAGELQGDAQQRRALVILVILGLDGRCQWAMLRAIADFWTRILHWNCERALKERLASL
jgi:hypothetical protein